MSSNLVSFADIPPSSSASKISQNENVFLTIDLGSAAEATKTSDCMEITEIMENNDTNDPCLIKEGPSYTSFGETLSPQKSSKDIMQNILLSQNSTKTVSSDSISSKDFVKIKSDSSFNSESPTSMLSSNSFIPSNFASKTASTLENFKLWGKSAYKCTKQIVSEKLGKSSRTIDPELDVSIDNLRETKKKYEIILEFSRNLSIHFMNILQTQKYLSDTFADLAHKSPELITEFTSNAETQRYLIKNGEHLLNAINHFSNSLTTLCEKTMEDTFITIRNYEAARLEYDAYRFDLEAIKSLSESKQSEVASLEHDVSIYKERYENLKKDVKIKMKFLDENRVKVMRKQLNQFQFAVSIYFSGNHERLEKTMKEFREQGIMNVSSSPESFLEKQNDSI